MKSSLDKHAAANADSLVTLELYDTLKSFDGLDWLTTNSALQKNLSAAYRGVSDQELAYIITPCTNKTNVKDEYDTHIQISQNHW